MHIRDILRDDFYLLLWHCGFLSMMQTRKSARILKGIRQERCHGQSLVSGAGAFATRIFLPGAAATPRGDRRGSTRHRGPSRHQRCGQDGRNRAHPQHPASAPERRGGNRRRVDDGGDIRHIPEDFLRLRAVTEAFAVLLPGDRDVCEIVRGRAAERAERWRRTGSYSTTSFITPGQPGSCRRSTGCSNRTRHAAMSARPFSSPSRQRV